MFLKLRSCAAAAAVALMGAMPAAHASYVVSSQGVGFTLMVIDSDTMTLLIEGAPDATGNWASATHLGAFGLKDLGFGASAVTATATYGSLIATANGHELNTHGCSNGNSDGLCFAWESTSPLLADEMLITIDVTGFDLGQLGASTLPHLKVDFTNDSGGNVGDLLSQAMAWRNDPSLEPGDEGDLPEPGSLALVGLALVGLGAARRRA